MTSRPWRSSATANSQVAPEPRLRPSEEPWAGSTVIWSLGLACLMLHPYVVVVLIQSDSDRLLGAAGHVCTFLAQAVVVGSAMILALDARVTGKLMAARLATATMLFAVQDLPWTVLALVDPSSPPYAYRLTPGHLITVATILAVIASGVRGGRPPRRSPLLVGLFLGLAVIAARLVVLQLIEDPFLSIHDSADIAVIALIAGATASMVIQLVLSPLPRWASVQLGLAIAALFLARMWVTMLQATTPPPGSVVGIVVFSALLATTATGLLRASISTTDARLASLVERTAEAEAVVKHDREVVHNLRATTAGIVAGAHLLAGGRIPPGPRRDALEQMVDAECSRLERSNLCPDPAQVTEFLLDEVVEPLVTAQEATGHHVCWHPIGHRVVGRRDALAETISILLTNAARHAQGRGTAVVSLELPDRVEISVSDRGPGIEHTIRARLFEWGSRGAVSGGEGIGLQRARRLIQEQGGSLTLDEQDSTGTTFVVSLPRGGSEGAPPEWSRPQEPRRDTDDSRGMTG